MPLPKRKKYGINYIFQPFWIQHLGVFSKSTLSEDNLKLFVDNIPKKIRLIDFNINFKTDSVSPRVNYILPLKNRYENIFKAFSKLRKRSIKKAVKNKVLLKKSDEWDELLNLSKLKSQKAFKMTAAAALKFDTLLKMVKKLKKLKIITAYVKDNELVGGAFFIISKNRITYLFSIINQEGKDLQAISLILNSVIKEYSATEYILDFEGSMLPGVARFIKSFGVQKEIYYHLKKWRLF